MFPQASVGLISESVPSQPMLNGIYLAQVAGVSADDHAIQVVFTTMAGILNSQNKNAIKVKVLQPRAGLHGAILELPQIGEWGLVCFPNGSDQMAVWLGSLNRDLSNLAWDGIGENTRLDQHESGVYRLLDDAGNLDMVFADGSYIRIGQGTDLAARFHHERQGQERRSPSFVNPVGNPGSIFLRHSSGTTVQIDQAGAVTVQGIGPITVHGTGNVTVQSDAVADVHGGGPNQTLIGGGQDYVVLLAGLMNLIAWLTSHTHMNVKAGIDNSGPPNGAPAPPTPGLDITLNTKAS